MYDEKNQQLRLMDDSDPTKMLICTVDNIMYERMKAEQCLNVEFEDFIRHLTTILDSCQKNKLLMSLMKTDTKLHLQFYERSSFRNFIHLFLPMSEAAIETVLYHINSSYNTMRDQVNKSAAHANRLESEINYRDENIKQLKIEIERLNEKITEQNNMVFNRNCEEVNKLQHTIKHLQDTKETEEKRLKGVIQQQQDQLDNLRKEIHMANDKIVQETIKSGTYRDEANSYKLNSSTIRERNERLQSELITVQSNNKRQEVVITENRRLVQELNEKIKKYEKYMNDMKAEVEAEKNICNTKRNALQIATEEIGKANEIIVKQSKEITVRTEVALKQEVHVKRIENENQLLRKQMKNIETAFFSNSNDQKEFASTLEKLKENTDQMEAKYKQSKFFWLLFFPAVLLFFNTFNYFLRDL